MAKEWILNMAMNRWGLNKKNRVGPVSEWIRECGPKTVDEWRSFYLDKLCHLVRSKGIDLSAKEYIEDIGRKLYVKITEVIQAEIDEVTEEDCVSYVYNLVIDRTFDGYQTEIKTVYGRLEQELGVEVRPAPDEWDRLYNVDFYIAINDKYIGLQIKPITYNQTPEIHKWKEWLSKTHRDFEKRFGGKVFIIFSVKRDGKKDIYNSEIVDDIKMEVSRIQGI